ncbi:MAG TPA: acyl-CoA dehydrogenase family protein [Anaeromyxobacter sp.]|nr:acyl-CoA dehydrogenase family protein [Anaeromyxobacter sp.]
MIDKRTASFMRSLAMGQIEEEILLPFPDPKLSEREALAGVLGRIGAILGPRRTEFSAWDREGAMPPSFLDELRRAGLFGLVIPEPFGGVGLSNTGYARALEEIARHDTSVAVTVGVHGSIGVRGLLLYGTAEQRARLLPRLAKGELLAAFCLTESGAGSDAASIRTSAVRDGGDFVLSGEKGWVSNGGISSLFTVFARTSQEGRGQLSAFLVPREAPGLTVGPPEEKMGIRASSTTRLELREVRVPADAVLGEMGQGFKIAMTVLNAGRTGLGGGSVGAMKRLIDLSLGHARERKQFGRPLAAFALVRGKLARMVVDCYAAESAVDLTAGLIDRGFEDLAVEAAIAKVLSTEALWRIADEAVQVAGGAGYMRSFPFEQAFRDARIHRIFDGSNDILRLFIALTAVSDVAEELRDVAESVRGVFADPIKGFGVLSEYARRRASLAANVARGRGRFTQLPPLLAEDAAGFEELVRAVALSVDRALRRHGKRLVDEQLVLARLADALIDLYACAAMLSRISGTVENHGDQAGRAEREILRAYAGAARRRVEAGLDGIDGPEDAALALVAEHALEQASLPWGSGPPSSP